MAGVFSSVGGGRDRRPRAAVARRDDVWPTTVPQRGDGRDDVDDNVHVPAGLTPPRPAPPDFVGLIFFSGGNTFLPAKLISQVSWLLVSWCAGHERECGVLQLLHHDAILEKGEEVKPLSYYVTHPTVPRS